LKLKETEMKKILITGANGSTGKILFKRLSKMYDTYGLVKKETSNRKFFTFKNILEKKINFHTIVHLAGTNPGQYSNISEKKILSNNNLINNKILLLSKLKKSKKIIFFSSFSVYQENKYINEETPITTKKAYSRSKINFEKKLKKINNLSTYILRSCAIVHPNSQNNWLSELRNKMTENKDIILFNKNYYYNNCIGIQDLTKIIIRIIDRPQIEKKIYNLSSNDPIQIKSIAAIIKKNKLYTGKLTFKNNTKSSYFFNDSSYIQKELNIKFGLVKKIIEKTFL
jgi:nucleoside-diphosphate-sugar epimerase